MSSLRLILLLCAAGAACLSVEQARAQVLNVESIRGDTEREPGWAGELRFDASLTRYRDRILNLGSSTNAGYYSINHSYLVLNSISLVNIDGTSVVSNGHVHLRAMFFRTRNWSPELFTQYQYNANLGMNSRFLAGGGVRYTFLNRDEINGHIGTGIMAESERWEENNTVTQWDRVKSTTNLVVRGQLNPQTQLLLIGYYQARPGQFFQPRVISENQLNIRMSERFSFAVNFTLSYDFNPVIDIPALTYELRNGLIISL